MTREMILIILGILAIALIIVLIYTSNNSKRIEDPYGAMDYSKSLMEAYQKSIEIMREKEKDDKPIEQLELHQQTRITGHRGSYLVTKVPGGLLYESISGHVVFVPYQEDNKKKLKEILKSEEFHKSLDKKFDHFTKRNRQKEEALLRLASTKSFENLYDFVFSEVTFYDSISDDDLYYHKSKYNLTIKQFRRFVDVVKLISPDRASMESDYYEDVRVFRDLTIRTVCGQGCFTTISRIK